MEKLIDYFFDSKEEYEEVEKYIKAILYAAPISLLLSLISF